MTRTGQALILAAAALQAVPVAQGRRSPAGSLLAPASMTPRIPSPTERHLDNGITVLLFEDRRVPLVSFRLVIRDAGFLQDPPSQPGLAAAVMSNLRETSFARSNFETRLETLGATLGVSVTAEAAAVQGEGLAQDFAELLRAGAAVVTGSIAQETFESHMARARLQTTRPSERDSINMLGRRLFPTESGEGSALEAASRFVRERLVSSDICLAVSGPFAADEMFSTIKEVFGSWSRRSNVSAGSRGSDLRPKVVLIPTDGAAQTRLVLGSAVADQRALDAPALLVLNQVLGAVGSGRLFRDLREQRGYAYSPSSTVVWANGASYFAATMAVNSERLSDALSATLAEIARLRSELVPSDELAAKKRALIAAVPLTMQDRATLQGAHVGLRLNGLPADYWNSYGSAIDAVTAEQVRDVARRYLDSSRLVFLMIGNAPAARAAAVGIGLPVEK